MSNPSLWFITRNGKEHGPLTVDAVKELVQKGQIQADTLVRRGDVAQAIPASQVRGLLPPVVPAPLAAPSTPLQPQPRPAVMPVNRPRDGLIDTAKPRGNLNSLPLIMISPSQSQVTSWTIMLNWPLPFPRIGRVFANA